MRYWNLKNPDINTATILFPNKKKHEHKWHERLCHMGNSTASNHAIFLNMHNLFTGTLPIRSIMYNYHNSKS